MKKRLAAALLTFVAVAGIFTGTRFDSAAFTYAYGVDVSYAQGGNVDWRRVRAANITFAILRIGYIDSGGAHIDAQFERNYANCKAAGVNVGAYFYTYGMSVADAEADAAQTIAWLAGRQLEYPVYYDMEEDRQTRLSTETRTQMCLAFCRKLREAGYLSGVYSSSDWYKTKLYKDQIAAQYEIWEAVWHNSRLPDEDKSGSCAMWQYSDRGYVDGFNNRVDMDVCYKDYPTLVKQNGLSGYEKQNVTLPSLSDLIPQLPNVSLASELTKPLFGEYRFSLGLFSSFLYNVEPGTELLAFIGNLDSAEPPVVTDLNGQEVTDEQALIGTGYRVRFLLLNYAIVVNCDLDGDGIATADDARTALRIALNLEKADSLKNAAADTDGDKQITASDARTILRTALGIREADGETP